MKLIKKIGLVFCAVIAVAGMNSLPVAAKKAKEAKNPEVITEGQLTRTIKYPNDNFEIKMHYGIAGTVFADYPAPLSIDITSKSDFSGAVRVAQMSDYGNGTVAKGAQISLAKGTTKTIRIDQDSLDDRGNYFIQIVDEAGDIVYGENDTIYPEYVAEKYYIATLCDDFSGLAYFDGLSVGVTNSNLETNLMELDEKVFPDKSRYLQPYNCIIMNNYDSSKLSQEQYDSLKQWVASGGNLIVGLGTNAKTTLQCFQDDFLAGTFGDISKKEIKLAGATNVDVLDFQLTNGEELSDIFDNGIAQYKTIGSGKVIVLGFDLTMEPLASAPDKTMLSNAIMTWLTTVNVSLANNSSPGYYGGSQIENAVGLINESPVPSSILYGLLFLVYSIVVGPVLYLVLKKKNKREYIWAAIPLTSVAFTVIISCISSVNRMKKPVMSSISVVTVNEGTKKEDLYFDILCPNPKNYTFMLDKEYDDVQIPRNINYSSMLWGGSYQDAEDGEYQVLIEQTSDGKRLDLNNTDAFTKHSFGLEKSSSNDIGMFDINLNPLPDGFEGTITNNTKYDLTNLIVYFEQKYAFIPAIAKGETVGIARDELKEGGGYSPFDTVFDRYDALGRNKDVVPASIAEGMLGEYVDKQNYGVAYVWANVGTYQPEILRDNSLSQYGMAVILQQQDINSDGRDGFCPNISALATGCDGDLDLEDARIHSDSATVTYVFDQYTTITELQNQNFKGDMSAKDIEMDNNYATVYAYNTETGDYDELFVDSATLSGKELEKYLAGNVLILRYNRGPDYASFIPRISLQGER